MTDIFQRRDKDCDRLTVADNGFEYLVVSIDQSPTDSTMYLSREHAKELVSALGEWLESKKS